MNRIIAMIKKEFIQMKRDRLTLMIAFMIPVVQLIIFGYAIQTEVKNISTIVFDQSLTTESRDMLESFSASGYFEIKYIANSYNDINHAIDSGKAKVGIIFPPDYAKSMGRGESAQFQVIIDASDNMTSGQAKAIASTIPMLKGQAEIFQKMPGNVVVPYDARIRAWYNPDGISAYYIVPGIVAILVTMTMVLLTSVGIVRERERGTLEQLMVTPLKPLEIMIGKITPYVLLGYIQVTVALIVAVSLFGVPIRGSVLELYILTLFFITASLGLGITISNIAKTQIQAMMMSFVVLLPSILLSGFMFPRDAMPKIIYYIGYIVPATYYLEIIRGIMLKGIGITYLWTQVGMLIIMSIVFVGISSKKFKKTVD
ncbi:MAG: ABC transporter permease [Eubacteriales bacterium]